MSVPAFFLKTGFGPEIIGITVGIHRFSGIAATAWIGPIIDRFNSRKVIIITELFAGLSSIGLVLGWSLLSNFGPILFLVFVGIRAISVGVQSSSRNRLIKIMSNENKHDEASMAIWLNKATQGAHLLSSLMAVPLMASGNFIYVIIIDGASFLIGGYSALLLPDVDKGGRESIYTNNILKALLNLIKQHRLTFIQDQLLALAVSGTILLMVKLSEGYSINIIYFNLIFGSCIWLSSIFAHNMKMRNHTLSYWLLILVGYATLYVSYGTRWQYISYFITYMGYWILYHKYTVEFQIQSKKESIGSVMATRGLAVACTLSLGELLGGYISNIFDVKSELIIRALICILAIIYISSMRKKAKM